MLIPLRDNILVAALDDPDTWYGSSLIVRPESTKDRSDQGIVKSVGPEVKDVQVGDYVVFNPYSGMVVNDADEGSKLIMLKEAGVIAIVTPPTTKVPGLFLLIGDTYEEAPAEAAMLILRDAYQRMPRVIEMKQKFEQRFSA
jgi:co-chaperonin GroES (HSP10)